MAFNEDLWEEIPRFAFMASGRRGREQISLIQCFIPGCTNTDDTNLHPIEKKVDTETFSEKRYKLEKVKYLIHCDQCAKNYHLVFEKHTDLDKSDEDNTEGLVIMELVYATDAEDHEDYREIGHIQGR